MWYLKNQRLISQCQFNTAFLSFEALIIFAFKYNLIKLKILAELQMIRVYISLEDYSQALILVTQTLSSLEGNYHDLLKLKAQILLAEIQLGLDLNYDSLKTCSKLFPLICENGSL